jgi:hypothetical protein
MKRHFGLAAAGVVLCGVVAGLRGSSRQDQADELRRTRAHALEKGGLSEAAKVSGSYRMSLSPHGGRDAGTLQFLVSNSELIVVGQVRSNRTWLNGSGDTITTDYEIRVERPLKGPVKAGDLLTVSVLGGRVSFPGGSWAQIDTPGMVPPLNNQTFVFFLERSDFRPSADERAAAHGGIYMPAFMSRGLYLIDGGIVQPRTFSRHPLAKAYAGKAETALENDVLDLVENRTHGGGVQQ